MWQGKVPVVFLLVISNNSDSHQQPDTFSGLGQGWKLQAVGAAATLNMGSGWFYSLIEYIKVHFAM